MSLTDSFFTISNQSFGEIKEKGSRFISFAFPVQTEEQAKLLLKELKKEHHAAAHVCWAYVLEPNGDLVKSSDDREPSGSAGRPILAAIQKRELTYVLIAVVRYFGGKLLGVPGLIQAYGGAAAEALNHSEVIEKRVFNQFFQPCPFERQHEVIRICKQHQLKFFPFSQNEEQGICIEVSPTMTEKVLESLQLGLFEPCVMQKVVYL